MAATELSFPVKDLFPQEGWQKACEADPVLKPIYLMINGKDSKIVNFVIDQLKDVDGKECKFGLTALSVAVMMRNHPVVDHLLSQKKANPNPQDNAGLTPLHYACALGDTYSISRLQEASKLATVTQDIFQLFPGWKSMLTEPQLEKESEFFKQTNAHYFDAVISDRENFCLLLKERLTRWNPNPAMATLNDELVRRFETREKESDLLVLGSQEGADLGIFAKKDIEAGKIIGIYSGKITFEKNLKNHEYFCDHIDGLELRDFVDMVNDGFPNAELKPVFLPDGRRYICLLALNPIKKGKAIFTNYLFTHKIKTEARKELNLEEMVAYFKQNSVLSLCEFIQSKSSSTMKDVDLLMNIEDKLAKLRYLYHTPSALILLYLKGIITDTELVYLNDKSFLLMLKAHLFDHLVPTLQVCQSNLVAYELLQMGKYSSIFFPDLKNMGITLLEKYSARVFLSLVALIALNQERMTGNWEVEKENILKTAEVLDSVISRFLPPQKEKPDEPYLIECKKVIINLPQIYQSYIKGACAPNVISGLEKEFSALFKSESPPKPDA